MNSDIQLVYKYVLLSSVLLVTCTQLAAQHCQDESNAACEEQNPASKYEVDSNARWSSLTSAVASSLSQYEDCSSEDHSCHSQVIAADLAPWVERGGIQRSEFEAAKSAGVHYQIINHTLYRSHDCLFGPRCKGAEHFILEILNDLPDMELIVNVHDYPKSIKHRSPLPIFSFSKTTAYYDIMYPAWSFWSGGPAIQTEPRGLGRWDEKRESITREASKWPWDKKQPVAFFRGSRTSSERDPLVLFSREHPSLADAQYTKNQAWRSINDTLGEPPADVVSLEEHCQYKYLFNFRGVAASFRFRHLFLCGSLVFHVDSEWVEFFYPSLQPWVHYIPVNPDLSNIRELLEFVKENDQIAQNIASRGFNFVWDHLEMADIYSYWRELLMQYSQLISWTVVHNKHTIPIIKPQ